MTEYRTARMDEEREILDFSNMVFAMSAGPIDFKRVYPSIYGREGFSRLHVIARDEKNRLVSSMAVKPMSIRLGEESLSLGFLGTVATHPAERGKGYMNHLMHMSLQKAREEGMEIMALGGQRQRYNSFDFENCAPTVKFEINERNIKKLSSNKKYDFVLMTEADERIKHAAYEAYQSLEMTAERRREDFADILRTAGGEGYAMISSGGVEGYLHANGDHIFEYAFTCEPDWAGMARSWVDFRAGRGFDIIVPPYQKDAVRAFAAVAESWSVRDEVMAHVLDWPSTLQKLMSFKTRHQELKDGEAVIEITGHSKIHLEVKDNHASVEPADHGAKPCAVFTPREAVSEILSSIGKLKETKDRFHGWFPLMLSIPRPDWF